MCALAYRLLANISASHCGKNSVLVQALGKDWKGKLSIIVYVMAMGVAFWVPNIACALYVAVACVWFIPDRRMEKKAMHYKGE